jgi:hypothetical protein
LGGPTRNTLKGQSRNKNWPNNILGPLSLHVFIIIIFFSSCLFIACQSIWLEVSITIKKDGNCYKFIFLIDVAPSGVKFLNFKNS